MTDTASGRLRERLQRRVQRRVQRRLLAAVAVAAGALLAGCSRTEPPQAPAPSGNVEPADLVLRGGKVITLDPELGVQQAIAVRGHSIAAVGNDEEITAYVGADTVVIELHGRPALPGFIEGHGHFMDLGRALQIIDLRDATSWDVIVQRVALAADGARPGAWIVGRGWHQDKWQRVPADAVEGVPRNDALNEAAPANPVLLGHASGHAVMVNDAALRATGIDVTTPDPPGGTIVRAPDGRATGLLRENAQNVAEAAVEAFEGRLPAEELNRLKRERVQLAGREALAHGVTSFHDAGESFATIDFFRKLEAEGSLPVRLYVMVRGPSNEEMDARLPAYRMVAQGNDFLTVRSIKRQIDGALGTHGAWLLEPYHDHPDTAGLILEPVEDIERSAEIAVKHGFQLATHAIGTRANREVLDIYQRAWKRAGVDGRELRWRVEHAQHLHPDDVPRFGQLGVIAAMQGIHCTSDGPWVAARLGEARATATSYPWRDLIGSGALIGNGTDVPVEPIDPIASYYASVSRMMGNGERFHPEQVMTRMEALQSYTINNAFAAFEENLKGSLTPGRLADIVVLSQDILTVAEDEIPATRVDYTVIGGRVGYAR